MALPLLHQTAAEFAARLRAKYRDSSREDCAKLATWLHDHFQAGDFTALQLRTAFGMTVAQFNAFVTKIQALRTNWLAVQAAGGE